MWWLYKKIMKLKTMNNGEAIIIGGSYALTDVRYEVWLYFEWISLEKRFEIDQSYMDSSSERYNRHQNVPSLMYVANIILLVTADNISNNSL